jgi:hypothetical protein
LAVRATPAKHFGGAIPTPEPAGEPEDGACFGVISSKRLDGRVPHEVLGPGVRRTGTVPDPQHRTRPRLQGFARVGVVPGCREPICDEPSAGIVVTDRGPNHHCGRDSGCGFVPLGRLGERRRGGAKSQETVPKDVEPYVPVEIDPVEVQ